MVTLEIYRKLLITDNANTLLKRSVGQGGGWCVKIYNIIMVRGLVRMQSTNNKLRVYFCRLKINSLSIRCLPRPPRQHCAALSTAVLVVVVVSSLCCCRCLSSLLSSPSLSSLSSLSPRPLRPLLPPPPITSSTQSP